MDISTITLSLLSGFTLSLKVFAATLLGAIPLGVVVCVLRMNKWGFTVAGRRICPISLLAQFFISVLRGTPLMLQLFVVYYGPYYAFGVPLDSDYFPAVAFAFILNYSAYFAEIYRSGIQSIPRGQFEAADVLGYSRLQAAFKIILPQVVKRILPPMTNEIITLVKDTSLAFALGFVEMFTTAKTLAAGQRSMVPFAIAAAIYYVFNLLIAFIMNRVEKKLDYYHD